MVAPASAQQVNAPPGNAGVDEYLESVPQADGNRPSHVKGAPLPAPARAKLEQQGPDGAAVARLAEATGPQAAPAGGSAGAPGSGSGTSAGSDRAVRSTGGGSIVESVAQTATGSSNGMGPALPIILALAAGLGAGALLTRRRRPPTSV